MTTWIVTTTIVTRVETLGPGEAMEVARTRIEAQLPGSSISHQRAIYDSRAEIATLAAELEDEEA